MCNSRVEEGSGEFSVIVEGVYIQEKRAVVKLHAVQEMNK